MDKRKITAREVVKDLRAGADDQTLMKKYQLSAQGLQSVFGKLVKAGAITQDELEERVPMTERTVDLGLYICPACGNIQEKAFEECPRCGFVPPAARKPKEEVQEKKEAARKKPLKTAPGRPSTAVVKTEPQEAITRPAAEAGPLAELSHLAGYCRILAVAALVSYGLIVIGVLAAVYWSVPPGARSVAEILLSLLAIGIPAVVLSLVILVALRALAESIKVFADVARQYPGPSDPTTR